MAFISSSPDTTKTREPEQREDTGEVITRLDRYFREAVDHPNRKEWLEEAQKAYNYRDGEQLDPKTKARLAKRGQPEVVENRCKVQIDRLLGLWRKQRTVTKFIGRNQPFDDDIANLLSDLGRWVNQTTQFEFEEAEVVKDTFTAGKGWIEWGIEHGEFGFQQIFARMEDPFVIFEDPFSKRYDINLDARYVIRAKWLDLEDAIDRWPDKEKELRMCVTLDSAQRTLVTGQIDPSFLSVPETYYIDSRRSRLRPVETWYKRKMVRTVMVTDEGVHVDVSALKGRDREALRKKGVIFSEDTVDEMWLAIHCGNMLIHHDRSPFLHNLYPFVPYGCYRKKSGVWFGWLLNLIPLQDELNKRRQKALHLILNQRVFYRKGAIKDPGLLAEELARPDGQIEVEGKLEDIEVDKNLDLGQGQLALHQETRQAFDDAAANSPVDFGQAPGEVRSDRGLARLQQASSLILSEIFSNIRRSRRSNERIKLELLKQIITEDLVIQVIDDPDKARNVEVQRDRFLTAKQRIFDLIVIDTQDFETTRSEQLALIFNQLPNILQFGPGWVGFMLELTDLRDKEGLMKTVQAIQTQPPIQPRVSMQLNWAEMSMVERAGWALALGQEKVAQAVLQGGEQSKQTLMAQVEQLKQASKEKMETLRIAQKDAEANGKSLREDQQIELEALKVIGGLNLEARGQDLQDNQAAVQAQVQSQKGTENG